MSNVLVDCCLHIFLTWSPHCYLLRIMRGNSFWQSLDWQIFNKMSSFSMELFCFVYLFVLISVFPCTKFIIKFFVVVFFFNGMPNPQLCRFFKVRRRRSQNKWGHEPACHKTVMSSVSSSQRSQCHTAYGKYHSVYFLSELVCKCGLSWFLSSAQQPKRISTS